MAAEIRRYADLVKQIIAEDESGRKFKDGCLCDADSDIRVLFSPKRIR